MPGFSSAGAVSAPNTNPLNLKVPVDDENTVFFRMKWSPEPLKAEVLNTYLHGKHEFPERIPGTYVTKANKSNDYLQDRALQRNFNFSGMNPYPVQDFAMVEDQRGPRADRSRETLVSSDSVHHPRAAQAAGGLQASGSRRRRRASVAAAGISRHPKPPHS